MVGVVGMPVKGLTGPLAEVAIGDVIEFKVNGSDLEAAPAAP